MGESVSAADFGSLYACHAKAVYRFALALTGNQAEAEDLTAEAFLRVWEAGSRVDHLTVRGYLATIVRNLHRSEWRRERKRSAMPDHVAAPVADPLVAVELERVLSALSELPALDRDVLALRAEAGLSYDEIAAATGLTAKAARVRARRARVKLDVHGSN